MGILSKAVVQVDKMFLPVEMESTPSSILTDEELAIAKRQWNTMLASGSPIVEMEGEPSLTVEIEYDGKRYRGTLLPVKDEE